MLSLVWVDSLLFRNKSSKATGCFHWFGSIPCFSGIKVPKPPIWCRSNRGEIRFANLALISGRQMSIRASTMSIFLVAMTNLGRNKTDCCYVLIFTFSNCYLFFTVFQERVSSISEPHRLLISFQASSSVLQILFFAGSIDLQDMCSNTRVL